MASLLYFFSYPNVLMTCPVLPLQKNIRDTHTRAAWVIHCDPVPHYWHQNDIGMTSGVWRGWHKHCMGTQWHTRAAHVWLFFLRGRGRPLTRVIPVFSVPYLLTLSPESRNISDFLPNDSKKSKIENFSPPLQDTLKNFSPPFTGRWKIPPPPLTQKFENTPKPI